MAEFNFQDKTIHYEVYGESGEWLLCLNGIMMSTLSWKPFIETFSANNRLVLFDFLDQGQSSRMSENYKQEVQAEVLEAVLAELNITRANIMGISYGGEVAIEHAIKYPKRIRRLFLANTVAKTDAWLTDIGTAWNAVGEQADGRAYYYTTIPAIYSAKFYSARLDWMRRREQILFPIMDNKTVMATFKRLVISAESYDVSDKLHLIDCPTLLVSCSDDVLTPLSMQRVLHDGIKGSEWIVINDCGHASMYEKPELFAALVLGWFNRIEKDIVV